MTSAKPITIDGKLFGAGWDVVHVQNALFVFLSHESSKHKITFAGGSAWCADCARVWYDDGAKVEDVS